VINRKLVERNAVLVRARVDLTVISSLIAEIVAQKSQDLETIC